MPIIKPARQFEGSDLTTNIFGKIIKDGVRTINFRDDKNKEGNFFFILPPYKVDASGRGISWKVVPVRDNFGVETKESFAISKNCPISYFASQVKSNFPEYAKIEKINEGGRTQTKYPTFGRQTNKVLFNVAYFKELSLGAHVLTLPQFGGAEHIEAWNRKKRPDGSDVPLINDPAQAAPVWIQLKRGVIGQPWVVTPDSSKTYELPEALSNSDYLYNLDDIVHYHDPEYLIEKLRMFTPSDIFNKCISGYNTGSFSLAGSSYKAVPSTAATTAPAQAQQQIPKAIIPTANIPSVQKEETVPQVQVANTSNPTASNAAPLTVEQAQAFLAKFREK